MSILRAKAIGISVVAALALSLGTVSISSAAYADVPAVKSTTPKSVAVRYSDDEIVQMLIFGQGKIAAAYPALAKQVVDGQTIPQIPTSVIARLTDQLMALDPTFHSIVTLGLQEKNPYAARAAIVQMNQDVKKWAATQSDSVAATQSDSVAPSQASPCNKNVCLYAYAGVSVSVLVAVVAVVSIAGVFLAFYRFGSVGNDELSRDSWAAQLTSAL